MKIIQFGQNEAEQNSYLVIQQSNCIVIDPGFNGVALIQAIQEKGLSLKAVLLTHGHFDHIRDIRKLQEHWMVPLYIHELDEAFLSNENWNGARFFGSNFVIRQSQAIKTFRDGDTLQFDDISIEVWHTPGHTRGSSCFLTQNALFSGDTLFKDSIGRSDLETGSMSDLRNSLTKLSSKVANDTIVYPGHQEKATMASIKKENILFQKYSKSK